MAVAAAGAAPANITNARLTSRALSGPLARAIDAEARAAAEPAWIAWEVPANASGGRACCSWGDGSATRCGCSLDEREGVSLGDRKDAGKVSLEASSVVVVLSRVQSGAVQRVVAYSADCEIDAGGRHVVVLSGVSPAESVAWLADLAGSTGAIERRVSAGAVAAMAFHAAPEADTALERLALRPDAGKPAQEAVFWMGAARGRVGFEGVRRVLAKATTDTLKERAIFALSISKEGDAVPVLIDAARNSASGKVRGQALFWLGQKAGAKVAGTLADAVEKDPDTKVKTQAVFALSQLPPGEGVPLLIQIARTNRNAAVRKQAMFWLGQSKDSRALAFFEEVLTGARR
ncbi:MAG: HEAT repeat domain-containing protein [Acidobacteriota bacterium]